MSIVTAKRSTVARVSLVEALDVGPSVWDDLLTRSTIRSPFMSWAWHRAWAEGAEGSAVQSSEVVVLRSASAKLEGLFPFRIFRTRVRGLPVSALGWAISDLGCPDHLELPASAEADLDALVAELDHMSWDLIRLDNVAHTAPNLERFAAACARRGWSVRRTPLWRCPYVELPESWEAYLSSLGPRWRRQVRRNESKLRRQHDVVLTEYGPARLQEGLQHLERLHARRWGGGGVFREPGMELLHRYLAALLADRGQLGLVTLDLNGAPAAAWYGFSLGDTVYSYQTGWDPRWERYSVGTVLMGLMIRRAIERGYRTFDLLRGEEPYKTVWTPTARTCWEVIVIRAGWRAAVLHGLDWIATRRAAKWLRAGTAHFRHVRTKELDSELV